MLPTAPTQPATAHIRAGLLNITEKKYTPMNVMSSRRQRYCVGVRSSGTRAPGASPTTLATIQPANVATTITVKAYPKRSNPLRMSSLAMSRPLVTSGNPGITKSMAPM